MRRNTAIMLLTILVLLAGCSIKNDCIETTMPQSVELIPNPMFEELTVEEITKIIAQITTLISEKISEREVEQTTLKKESATSAKMADVVEIVNNYRTESNLNRLKMSDSLCEIAEIRAKEASEKWSHTRPNGQNIDSLLEDSEWKTAGENLAKYRVSTPSDIVESWMNSDSHRANLLDFRYKYYGIAEYYDGKNRYISMIFTD